MRKAMTWILGLSIASAAFAASGPVDRWANAIGGRDTIAKVKCIYREGTIDLNGMKGTIKVWHTADGRYRKEERVAVFSSVETFDGKNLLVKKGTAEAQKLEGDELAVETSKAFANSNAIFFVFAGDHHGTINAEGNDTVVFQPQGGIEWRVQLDPQTSLPASMIHKEGDRTITAAFASWETVDGLKLEKEIHRSSGEGRPVVVITFDKTVINPTVDSSLFTQ
ncbi:MAG TPA: hypothetical protein VF219_19265 [Vicinamibacterales bacterium]